MTVQIFFRWIILLSTIMSLAHPAMAQDKALIDSLEQLLTVENSPQKKASILNDLSSLYLHSDAEKGLSYARQAMDFASQTDIKEELARAYNYMGNSSIYLSNFDEALDYYDQSLSIYKELDLKKNVADIQGNIGMVYSVLGRYSEALNVQFQALEVFEQVGDTTSLSNTHMSIGSIYMETGSLSKAIYHDSLSLLGYQSIGDKRGQAVVIGNMANIYMDLNQLDLAKSYLDQSIKLFRELQSPIDLARQLTNLSTLYEKQLNFRLAIEASTEAATIFRTTGFQNGLSYALGNIGAFYLSSHQSILTGDTTATLPNDPPERYLTLAQSHLEEAIALAEGNNDVKVVGQLSGLIAEIYEFNNEPTKALHYYKIFKEVQDSIHSLETNTAIQKLTTERELALKNKQIELDRLAVAKKRNERRYFILGLILLASFLIMIYINYRNQVKSNVQLADTNQNLNKTLRELNETQEQLIESERQKEQALIRSRISQDIHDDISSGLTKISWLSERLKSNPKKHAITDQMSLIDKINQSSRDTVSKLGEIIWSTNPDADNLENLLSYIRNHSFSFLEDSDIRPELDFPTDVAHIEIDPQVRRNLYLIFKEALNNTFKYSQASVVRLAMKVINDQYIFSIADNGVGIEEGEIKGGGYGLRNMTSRAHAINAQLSIDSSPQTGTTITCQGPLTK